MGKLKSVSAILAVTMSLFSCTREEPSGGGTSGGACLAPNPAKFGLFFQEVFHNTDSKTYAYSSNTTNLLGITRKLIGGEWCNDTVPSPGEAQYEDTGLQFTFPPMRFEVFDTFYDQQKGGEQHLFLDSGQEIQYLSTPSDHSTPTGSTVITRGLNKSGWGFEFELDKFEIAANRIFKAKLRWIEIGTNQYQELIFYKHPITQRIPHEELLESKGPYSYESVIPPSTPGVTLPEGLIVSVTQAGKSVRETKESFHVPIHSVPLEIDLKFVAPKQPKRDIMSFISFDLVYDTGYAGTIKIPMFIGLKLKKDHR